MKTSRVKAALTAAILIICGSVSAQAPANIHIQSREASGLIDSKIYGQLFEHIYFSANNGVWQELIYERSFEPEHYPGIHPRDGYFDGWFADDEQVLHSPTRYEQPIALTSVDTDNYDITMDVKWRSYRLARRSWSGGLLDIRVAFKNHEDVSPYYLRINDPYFDSSRRFTPAQTESQIAADREAQEREKLQALTKNAHFSLSRMVEREISFMGRTRSISALEPYKVKEASQGQIDRDGNWHKVRISCRGANVKVYWDDKQVLSGKLENVSKKDITLWVNYTEAYFRNIKVTSGAKTWFEGLPAQVAIPEVAPQWKAFGEGSFCLVKDDAVNMRYSQKITSSTEAGVCQGPQNVVAGEKFIGSVYAKGEGRLSVSLRKGDKIVASKDFGPVTKDWKKYEFSLPAGDYTGDADFAVSVSGGSVQIDQATMTTASGLALGGFRPDIFKAVKELAPTCLRWPGGGYVAQYHWQWGIGPQEERYRWPHWMWMDYDQNCFGTDEFIRFCREINTEPVIVVSVGFERPESEYEAIKEEALNGLRYCNEPASGEWGAKRAANGHPEPYNVKYWEIDNEMWEMGIERYERCVRDFSTAMREIDPNIRIIVCGGYPEDADFIKRSAGYFDYMSLHHYEQQGGYATGPKRLEQQYQRYARMFAESPNPNVKLFISEWNLQSIDWRTGLFAGGFLNMCENNPVVELGAAALFIRRTDSPDWNNAFINFNYKDLFVAPNYQVTKLWKDNFSRYRLAWDCDNEDLSVSATMAENGSAVIVKLVNPTDKEIETVIDGEWASITGATWDFYAPGDLMAANSMDNKAAVALKHSDIPASGNSLRLTLPAYSAGVVRIPVSNAE